MIQRVNIRAEMARLKLPFAADPKLRREVTQALAPQVNALALRQPQYSEKRLIAFTTRALQFIAKNPPRTLAELDRHRTALMTFTHAVLDEPRLLDRNLTLAETVRAHERHVRSLARSLARLPQPFRRILWESSDHAHRLTTLDHPAHIALQGFALRSDLLSIGAGRLPPDPHDEDWRRLVPAWRLVQKGVLRFFSIDDARGPRATLRVSVKSRCLMEVSGAGDASLLRTDRHFAATVQGIGYLARQGMIDGVGPFPANNAELTRALKACRLPLSYAESPRRTVGEQHGE